MVTVECVLAVLEADENEGICMSCGAEVHGVELDVRDMCCPSCGEFEVCGAEEALAAL